MNKKRQLPSLKYTPYAAANDIEAIEESDQIIFSGAVSVGSMTTNYQ
jgi:hypothetical protein